MDIRAMATVTPSTISRIFLPACQRPGRSFLLRFLPPAIIEAGWWTWALLDPPSRLGRFAEPTPYAGHYYYMTLTMVLGSLVAGATSEGGGAVAFPVMTLLLGVPPVVARDFSFAIQSFGMTCASVAILGLGAPIDREAILWGSAGGAAGLVAGLVAVAPRLPAAYAKMLFVSAWIAFAVALFRLNRADPNRRVYQSARDSDTAVMGSGDESEVEGDGGDPVTGEDRWDEDTNTKSVLKENALSTARRRRAAALFLTGTFGGVCSSVAGSGLDMASFSVLTLYYRVSEKVATPTSVVLMAANAVLGTVCRSLIGLGGAYRPGEAEAVWAFVSVCVPVVVVGAPLGATVSARLLSRRDISRILYVLDVVQFVAALAIVRPWTAPYPHNVGLCVSSTGTLVVGSAFFYKVANWGDWRDAGADIESSDLPEWIRKDSEAGSGDMGETSTDGGEKTSSIRSLVHTACN